MGAFFMDKYDLTRMVIAVAMLVIAGAYMARGLIKTKTANAKFITRTAIFAAMSIILYIVPALKFPLPIFPAFLEIHFDEVPLLIAGFAYGPWSGLFALLIKTIVKLPMTNTMCVGELADFIYSAFFIIPAAIFYKKHRNIKGAIISLLIGVVFQLFASCFITTFLILDFYMTVMNLPRAAIMGMVQKAGIAIDSLDWPFLFAVALPFNALKDAMVVILTLLLYKRIHKLVEKVAD